MKNLIKKNLFAVGFLILSIPALPQCQILNRVSPDGSMQYFMEPVNFYWTSTMSLKGCIVTDRENYFLELQPVPFPEKPDGNKLKKDLILMLSNDRMVKLKHYDTRYVERDTVLEMLFFMNKEDMEYLQNFEVTEATIDMMGAEGARTYIFKLHKAALKEQLACFLKEEEKRKKK